MSKQKSVVKEETKVEQGQVASVEPKVEAPVSLDAVATTAAVEKVSAKPVTAVAASKPDAKAKVEKKIPAKAVAAKPAATPVAKVKGEKKAPVEPVSASVKESKTKKQSPKKPKLVRDSFTFPESDYARIDLLKQRALIAGREIKKSELLRAGLVTLCDLPDDKLVAVLDSVDKLKPGRPSK
jgi:hypothetical protein